MKTKWFMLLAVVAVVALLAAMLPMTGGARAVDSPAYMPPRPDLGDRLQELGVFPEDATPEEVQALLKQYLVEKLGARGEPGGPNPRAYEKLLRRERSLLRGGRPAGHGDFLLRPNGLTGTAKLLVILVEFELGPHHNEIPHPGPRDNNTLWVDDFSPSHYYDMNFGIGPTGGIGTVRTDLNPGRNPGVDLSGLTMANYYQEQSGGVFSVAGEVYGWYELLGHDEEDYGGDGTGTDNLYGPAWRLTVEAVKLADGTVNWDEYDTDDDGILDHVLIIHSGVGQEAGGGAQGDDAIWSHSWDVGGGGYTVCTAGESDCDASHDIKVLNYTMMPEDGAIGVFCHEFGHDLGLPDLYSYDASNSTGFWDLMSSGSWAGPLGGAQPSHIGIWGKWVLGWADLTTLDTTSSDQTIVLDEAEVHDGYPTDGLRIDLPVQVDDIPNPMGTGAAWWSDKGNDLDNTLTQFFDLSGATAPVVFSFATYWDIEEDWDYGYFEVSVDGGASWMSICDVGGILTTDNPNGTNIGCGLTGSGSETLSFDLTTYVTTSTGVRLRYKTDSAVANPAWWADDFAISGSVFDDVESGPAGWTAAGWVIVPLTREYPHYYIAEWRNDSGFDQGLRYAYNTLYADEDEWQVERVPYTVPGMLLWYRNWKYTENLYISGTLFDDPSWGIKGMLLVVDSHPDPYRWPHGDGDAPGQGVPAGYNLSGRVQTSNATFGLKETTSFKLRHSRRFGPLPPVSVFDDSLGYYPGIEGPYAGDFWFADWDASVVIPATGFYYPRWPYYGETGNPGDSGVDYGVNLVVEDQAADGAFGVIGFSMD